MDNRIPPQPISLPAMQQLRERMPELHPVAALILTLEIMLQQGEVSSEEYLRLSAFLVASYDKWLFSLN